MLYARGVMRAICLSLYITVLYGLRFCPNMVQWLSSIFYFNCLVSTNKPSLTRHIVTICFLTDCNGATTAAVVHNVHYFYVGGGDRIG